MPLLSPKKQSGFSLIELVTVLLIITVLSTIAIRSTVDIGYSARYEQTRDRVGIIKDGIVGNPNRLVNGLPNIGGFIEDMGRLPDNVRELIQMGYCATSTTVPDPPTSAAHINSARSPNNCAGASLAWRWSDSPCTDGVATTKAACTSFHLWMANDIDGTTNLSLGWDGPYLSISDNPANNDAYTDGWGRITNDYNYGWNFNSAGSPNLILQSFGKDQVASGAEYDADYPVTAIALRANDWQRYLDGISVNIRSSFQGTCGSSTCSNPKYTLQSSCELDIKSWDSVNLRCLVPIYTTPSSCLTPYAWDLTLVAGCKDSRFSDEPSCISKNNSWINHNSESNCEVAGETWTISTTTICMKAFYRTVDSNGKTIINTASPLVSSPSVNILEDGQEHLTIFNGFFNDINNNGIQDAGELSISIPVGQSALGIYEYSAGACTLNRYKSLASDEITIIYPLPNDLPIINW